MTINLARFKADSFDAACLMALPVCDDDGKRLADLVPIGAWALDKDHLIADFTRWRQLFMRFFLTRFTATNEGTRAYLERVAIAKPDRILFAIRADEQFIGHIGLCNVTLCEAELDNIIRGVSGGAPDLIYHAEKAVLSWAFNDIGVEAVTAQVMSRNFLAMTLHERFGFRLRERFALKKTVTGDVTAYERCAEDEATESFALDLLVLDRSSFEKAVTD